MHNKAGLLFTPHFFLDIGHRMIEHVCYSDKNIPNTDASIPPFGMGKYQEIDQRFRCSFHAIKNLI